MEKTKNGESFLNIESIDGLVLAFVEGFVPYPQVSQELHGLFRQAVAATSLASGTKSSIKKLGIVSPVSVAL